jgi:hypothetical protein
MAHPLERFEIAFGAMEGLGYLGRECGVGLGLGYLVGLYGKI